MSTVERKVTKEETVGIKCDGCGRIDSVRLWSLLESLKIWKHTWLVSGERRDYCSDRCEFFATKIQFIPQNTRDHIKEALRNQESNPIT